MPHLPVWLGWATNTAAAVVTLHFSSCWVALRHGSGRVCLGSWRFPSASGGCPPQAFTPFGEVGLLPGAPHKRNADGAKGIFGHAGRTWAPALHPNPPKKRPCAILVQLVGRRTDTAAAVVSTLPVLVYIEPRKPSSETWIHLCGTLYLRVELFIDP